MLGLIQLYGLEKQDKIKDIIGNIYTKQGLQNFLRF